MSAQGRVLRSFYMSGMTWMRRNNWSSLKAAQYLGTGPSRWKSGGARACLKQARGSRAAWKNCMSLQQLAAESDSAPGLPWRRCHASIAIAR